LPTVGTESWNSESSPRYRGNKKAPSIWRCFLYRSIGLANHLYTLLEKGIQVPDKAHLARRAFPPTEAAALLKGLVRHHYEISHECTQRRNKLIAIYDELFPEFTQVFKDPNGPSALEKREQFSTPQAVATASITALHDARIAHYPSDENLVVLQQLASQSIGTHNLGRQRGLLLEQTQLITELKLLQNHIEQLDQEIIHIVSNSREGKILTSIPPIGPIQAAMMIAAIGTIANFPDAAALKSYFGWAPSVVQSGVSLNLNSLTQGGTRSLKKMMFLIVGSASFTHSSKKIGRFWLPTFRYEPSRTNLVRSSHSSSTSGRRLLFTEATWATGKNYSTSSIAKVRFHENQLM
jgi:hypothetical protein